MSNPCNDQWTSKDKALHFGVCFALACICPIVADVVGIVVGTGVHIGLRWLLIC